MVGGAVQDVEFAGAAESLFAGGGCGGHDVADHGEEAAVGRDRQHPAAARQLDLEPRTAARATERW